MVYFDPPPSQHTHLPGTVNLSPANISPQNTLGVVGVGILSVVFGVLLSIMEKVPIFREYSGVSGIIFIVLFYFFLLRLFSLRYRIDERARQISVEVKRLGLVTKRVISFDEICFVYANSHHQRTQTGYQLYLITEGGLRIMLDRIIGAGNKEETTQRTIHVKERLEEYAELFAAELLPPKYSMRYYFYSSRLAVQGLASARQKGKGYLHVNFWLPFILYTFLFFLYFLCAERFYIQCFEMFRLKLYHPELWGLSLYVCLPVGIYFYVLDP